MHWPEPETIERMGWTLSAFFFLIAIVSAVGDFFNWWDALGELGITLGTVVGALVAAGTVLFGASRRQVGRVALTLSSSIGSVREAVGGVAVAVGGLGLAVDGVAAGVGGVAEGVGAANRKLDSMDVKLDKLEKLDELDRISAALDLQTGVLDRQAGIFVQIRDRL